MLWKSQAGIREILLRIRGEKCEDYRRIKMNIARIASEDRRPTNVSTVCL
jgi:hypothetical protein